MHQQVFRECLSEHDKKVLDSLFVPFQIGDSVPETFNLEIEAEVTDPSEELNPHVEESIKLEVKGIHLAEAGKLDEAVLLFDQAIKLAQHRGSVYNNKAQALRLIGKDEDALNSLNKAIELSTQQRRTRCQSLCQRGLLYRKMENVSAAKSDFEEAAKLGSKFAKTQLVELNPYAALCNQMLQATFAKMQ